MQEIASFTFDWPKGPSEVFITGSFDGWQNQVPLVKQADGSHTITVPLKFDDEHKKVFFKYIVDGEWLTSKDYKKEFDNNGFENNFVEVSDVRDLLKDHTKGIGSRIPESGGLMALSSMGNTNKSAGHNNNNNNNNNEKVTTMPVETAEADTNVFKNPAYAMGGPGPAIPGSMPPVTNDQQQDDTMDQGMSTKDVKVNVPGQFNILPVDTDPSATNAFANQNNPMAGPGPAIPSGDQMEAFTKFRNERGEYVTKEQMEHEKGLKIGNSHTLTPTAGVSITSAAAIATAAAFSKKIGAHHVNRDPSPQQSKPMMKHTSSTNVSSTAAVAVTNAAAIATGAAFSKKIGAKSIDFNKNCVSPSMSGMYSDKMHKSSSKVSSTAAVAVTSAAAIATGAAFSKKIGAKKVDLYAVPAMMSKEPQMKKTETFTDKVKETEQKMDKKRESTRERVEGKIMETNNNLDQRFNNVKSEVQGNAMYIKEKVNETLHPEEKENNEMGLKKEPTPMAVETPMNAAMQNDTQTFAPGKMTSATSKPVVHADPMDPMVHSSHPPKTEPMQKDESQMKHADPNDPRLYVAHGTPDNSKEALPQSTNASATAPVATTPRKKTPTKTSTPKKAMKTNASTSTPAKEEKKKGFFTKIKKIFKSKN